MKEDLKALNSFIDRLKSTSSRLSKEEILRGASEFEKEVLRFLMNPYIVTGIGRKKLNKPFTSNCQEPLSLLSLLNYLKKHNTGSDKDIEYVLQVAFSNGYPDLVESIVCKDLRVGVNATTLNKVFGVSFIPSFGVRLAEKYFDDPDSYIPEGEEFIITEKLDGVRCLLIYDELDVPHFYARSGKEFKGMVELISEANRLDKNFVYDGELLAEKAGKSNDRYRATMSIVGSEGVKRQLVFNVFDVIPAEDFKSGFCEIPTYLRKEMVDQLLRSCQYIVPLPIIYKGVDRSQIIHQLNVYTAKGSEGVMVDLAGFPYESKRTKGLLKVKRFNECEGFVIDIEKGTGRNSDRLGAVIVEIKDANGRFHRVRVGSGFKDSDRVFYFNNPQAVINKVVEIGFFEVTENKGDDSLSLRFPTWLNRIRIDKERTDMTPIYQKN